MAETSPSIPSIQSVRIADWIETMPGQVRIADLLYDVGDLIDLSDEQCIVRLKSAMQQNGHPANHPFTLFILGTDRLSRMPREIQRFLNDVKKKNASPPVLAAQPAVARATPTPALEAADSTNTTAPNLVDAARPSARYGAEDALDDVGTGAETQLGSRRDPGAFTSPAAGLRPAPGGTVLQRPASAGTAGGEYHYLLFDDRPGMELQDWFARAMQDASLPAGRDSLQPAQVPAFLSIVGRAMTFLFDAFEGLAAEQIVWQNTSPLFLVPDPAVEGGHRLEVTGLRRFRPSLGAGYPERTWHRLYAAPEAHNGQGLTPRSDVFTAGIALYSLLSGVDTHRWEIGGEAQMLPNLRTFWRHCPAGIVPVLAQLLRHEEQYRPSLPEARRLVDLALKQAVSERLYRCDAATAGGQNLAPVRTFETSAMTLNGWVKELRAQQSRQGIVMSRPNQDAAFLSERIDSIRLIGGDENSAPVGLAVVADGISTCRFGRGELASEAVVSAYSEVWQLWLDGLRAHHWCWESDPSEIFARIFLNRFSLDGSVDAAAGRFMRRFSFPHLVAECVRRATLKIWSLVGEEVKASPNADPAEIMGSTMIAAFAHGNRVMLANLGDSRAYLVSPGADPEQIWTIECLTCDHDERNRLFREEQAMPQHMLGLSGLESLTNGIGSLLTTQLRPGSRAGLSRRVEHPDRFRNSDVSGGLRTIGKSCENWRPAY
ncbi:MAG TPA: hypothetical protein VL860_12425, partial [Planctomycetota bacterium]|nr:hypothetical protein [Planctomycetota bacterium]